MNYIFNEPKRICKYLYICKVVHTKTAFTPDAVNMLLLYVSVSVQMYRNACLHLRTNTYVY